MSVKSTTTNLGLTKFSRGHPVNDVDLGDNMDLIDAAVGGITALADGKIIVGSALGVASDVDVSGDATIANTGAVTIATGAVEDSMIEGLGDGEFIIGVDGTAANNSKVTMSGDATLANDGALTVAAGSIEQTMHVAASEDGTIAKVVAESNVIGGIPLIFMIPIAAGALGDTDIIMTHKIRVLDLYLVLRGAGIATTTLQVKNGANAITDAMDASGSDTDLVRAGNIDDANYEIAATGTLRVTSATGATQPDALVVVTAVRVA